MNRNTFIVLLIFLIFAVISFLTNILGPLVPDIIDSFDLSIGLAGFLPFSFFVAYGVMSIPSGVLIERYSEKRVLILGFVLAFIAALVFAFFPTFEIALLSLFTIGIGMAMLQVVINPLLRHTGGEEHFAFNSVLANFFFGLASFLSPLLYSAMVGNIHTDHTSGIFLIFNRLVTPELKWVSLYWVFAVTCILMIVVIASIRFPKVELKADERMDTGAAFRDLLKNKIVWLYFIGIFCYVGTEQGIANWMSKFLQLYHGLDPATDGATAISYFWGLITLGCFLGLFLLKAFDSRSVLIAFAFGAIVTLGFALFGSAGISVIAFPITGFFLSIMWSVVFSLGMNSVPHHHGTFSGILCTGIVGGAVVPLIIGGIAELTGLRMAMITLFITLGYILGVGIWANPLINNATIKNWSELFRIKASQLIYQLKAIPMNSLPVVDLLIIIAYLGAMIGVGVYFSRKNNTTDQFTKASGHIQGWALGLSLYATFLSSNTFLGVPGKAFGSNWNSFVFSLSMPFAAWIAARYFVPFYRKSGEISAYTHLEKRFGPWARTYAMLCFVLTQLARMGSIFFGIALTLQALTGIDMRTIMIVSGLCIIIYTMLGGMEAVIWTEVAQGIIKTIGAIVVLGIIISEMKNGFNDILIIGDSDNKFSLGSFSLTDFSSSTFWVVFLYGFFINLNNFGIDQNYVQRYHTAKTEKEAVRSVWLCVYWYLPVSLVFFFIGTALYAYFQQHPELIAAVKEQVALEKNVPISALTPADYGDKVLPHFMVTRVPHGLLGLIIAAILSAAMSTISSGMNSSATVFLKDIYQRYINKDISPRKEMWVLYIATGTMGLLAISTGIIMMGVKSILDLWWQLAGIFAGGMLGLFLLGMTVRRAGNEAAKLATIIGVLVIMWMTFSAMLPDDLERWRNPLHINMVIVVGTLAIFLFGVLISRIKPTHKGDV